MKLDKDISAMPITVICRRIEHLTSGMMTFWNSAHGWAPIDAAGLLSKSALYWQTSLSGSLLHWLESTSDGDLILAWANLGSLVEGQLKLFLSVYYNDYTKDADSIKNKQGKHCDPDECSLEPLRQFFVKRIWTTGTNWNPYVQRVQNRRNAIHAFKRRKIGSFHDWRKDMALHLSFVRDVNGRLPYPDDRYTPRET